MSEIRTDVEVKTPIAISAIPKLDKDGKPVIEVVSIQDAEVLSEASAPKKQ